MGLADYKEQFTAGKRETTLSPEAAARKKSLVSIEAELALIAKRMTENRLLYYTPYPKQREFHTAGNHTERLLMAANRVGKTWCGGAEIAMHLTGIYPADWPGRRYDRPVRGWAAGVTGESTRDVVQEVLIGPLTTAWGTGMIPKDRLSRDKMTLARGVSNLLDTVHVKNNFGGFSELKFKSYERGAEKWQGDTLDFVWFDEEPPLDIYTEGYTRVATTNGFVILTFTPLQGRSDVVARFLDEASEYRHVTNMTHEDAPHITPEKAAELLAGYPEHEKEARTKGIPVLGAGKIFKTLEASIECDPFEIPRHWRLLWGFDFGTTHPFAAVLCAHDTDTDTVYIIHTIRMKNATPLQHAYAVKPLLGGVGGKVPVAWPHDGQQRKDFEGELVPLAQIYKKYGLNMLSGHATFPDGSNSTEIGVLMMDERMKTNRLKVFKTCRDWWSEYRLYHRDKEGKINKKEDDLMSASRMAIMALRNARPVLWHDRPGAGKAQMAKDIDIDPWAR